MKPFWRSSKRESAGTSLTEAPADAETRLVLPTSVADARFVLSLPGGQRQEFTLSKSNVAIGRAAANDIVLFDTSVSRRHARVERGAQGWEVIDLGSANGISVNGVPAARARLKPNDVIGIGDCSLRFNRDGDVRDPDVTQFNSEKDFESSLLKSTLSTNLGETALTRVVVLLPDQTWEVPLRGDSLTIGRKADNDVTIESDTVSRHHAVIERKAGGFSIRDLDSQNGTQIRGQSLSSKLLEDGDTIRVGIARLVFKRGFAADDLELQDPALKARNERPAVIVVPGFAGSALWSGSEQVWPTRAALLQSELMRIDHPLEARGLVNEIVIVPNLIKQDQYSSLTNYLTESLGYERGKDLMEFGYDFRQDNRDSARRLAAAVECWDARGPITIIAHSMGCLVARYYLERLGGSSRVDRGIFLGGPHSGTPFAFASLMSGPNLLPMGLMNARLRDLLATYPSWYQILPTYPFVSDQRGQFDVLNDESWLSADRRNLIRQAREFRAELGTTSSVPAVSVFGYGIKTTTAMTVEREALGAFRKPNFTVTTRGDGTIPEFSGVLAGTEIHPVQQHHGSLYADSDVKMRLKLELMRAAASPQ
jgi:pSer/pThr/pTyr-binding forkhead associated (FHA) protein